MSFRKARAVVDSWKKALMQVSNYTLKLRNSSRGFVTFISFKALLRKEIQCALRQVPLPTRNIQVKESAIPFTIRQKGNLIHYRSAIAIALATQASIEATEIAQQLAIYLQPALHQHLIPIQNIGSGWIQFTLTEGTIQSWLQQCLTPFPALPVSFPLIETPLSFSQYTHHRCCRLLQLGAEANLISLTDNTGNDTNCSLGKQNLLQPEDWQFIYQLIMTIDHLQNSYRSQRTSKLANHLSEAFIRFHRCCRIFDRQQPHFPQIAMMRLNLIAIAQGVLQYLTDDF